MYTLAYSKRFEKQIHKIPSKYQLLIIKDIIKCSKNPQKDSIKLIDTKPPIYRLRVGDYRIFFELDNSSKTMIVTDVLRRTTQTYH